MNAYQKILNEMAAATATNERAVSTGKPIYNPVPKPMSFQEFHQGYQQAKQQAIIAGASSEAARREHIAQKAPSYEVVRNGMYSFAKETDPQKKASYAGKMKELTQKQYDSYINSQEYVKNIQKNLRMDMLDQARTGEFGRTYQPRQDQKEVELKTALDFWTQQEKEQNDRVTTMRNVQEFLSWSEEDQQKMRLFNENRVGRLSSFSAVADPANSRQAYENAERMGLAMAAEMELAQKYGEDKVQELAESLSWWENELKTTAARQKYSDVEDGFWPGLWASIEGRAYNAAGSVTGTLGQLQNLIIRPTGQYSTLDPNNLGNLPNVVGQTLTGAVAENIRGQEPTAGSEALAAIYKAGMSSADSLIRAYMGGGVKGISRALIASSAFGNAMAEYSAQGASPMEAVLMSTVDAGLEVLTEEIPLDRIIKQAEIAPASLGKWLKESAKSAVIEMGEEGTNFIGSAIAQSVILRDKSEYNQSIAQLMMQGVDYQKAKAAADREMVIQGAMTLIESAMSGGMMGGTAQAVGAAKAKGLGIKLDRAGVGQADINAVIREGLKQDPQTPAYQVAQEMQQKLEKGKSLSQYDLGRLYQSSVMTGQQGEQNTDTAEQNTITAEQNPVTAEQNNNTGVQTDNTGVESDVNAVQTGEQADTEEQGVKDIMQPEQETVVVAKDEVPMESLKPEVAQSLKRMSEATGRKVHAYTKPAGDTVVENGYFKDGEIWINTEGRLPHVQVFSHELTHSIETSRYYADIREIAFRELGKKLDLDSYRKGTKELYESNGQRVTKEDIDREIVAEYVADYLLADEQSILKLTRENRGIAKKVLNWIDGMLARFGNKKAQERVFLQNARSIYARALNETRAQNTAKTEVQGQAQTNQQAATQTGGQVEAGFDWEQNQSTDMESYRDWIEGQYRAGVMDEEEYQGYLDYFREQEEEGNLKKRYSYAGQGARTADLNGLETARQMEEQEVSAETIRQQTGWFRGMDGKWRFEIDDSQSRVRETDLVYTKLGDVLEHDELFEAYPDLQDIDVFFTIMGEGTRAKYDPKGRSIDINSNLKGKPDEIRKAILHELQHDTQYREGFTKGATARYWEKKIQNGMDSRKPEDIRKDQEIQQKLNRIQREDPEFYRDMVELDRMKPNVPRGAMDWNTLRKIEEDPQEWKDYDAYRRTMAQRYGDRKVSDLSKLLFEKKKAAKKPARTGLDLYYDTAGEIEARDVASRASLDEEGRKKTPPNLGDEDTVFSEGSENYDIVALENGNVYVKASRNVINGTTVAEKRAEITKFFNALLDGNPSIDIHTIDGDVLTITKKETANKARDNFKTESGKYVRMTDDEFSVKMSIESHIDEVAEVSKQLNRKQDMKNHSFAKDGFTYRRAFFEDFDGQYYEVTLSIGNSGTTATVYNVGKVNGSVPPSAKLIAVVGSKPLGGTLPDNSIEQESRNVNKQFSISQVGKVEEQAKEQQEKTVRERMNRKGREYLAGVERKMVNSIAQKLNVPYYAKREKLMPIMQKLSDTYLETGRIDPETERQLYDEALDQMLVINREFYDQYKDVKDWIRTVGLSISKQDQADIADFADFKKRVFGTVKIVKDGTPVETAYRELREMAPELFPEKIMYPADQLQRIYDVARSIEVSKKTLDEAYGKNAEEVRQWYRNDMNTAMMEKILPELKKVKRYADQTAAMEERESVFPKTEQEAAAAFESMKQARDEYEKIRGKKLIDPMTEEVIGKLLREEMTPEDLNSGKYAELDKDDILSIFEAKKKYEGFAKQISRYKRHVKRQLREDADRLLGDSIDWKDKPMGLLYARETMQRNVLDIVPDKQRAQEINRTYFEPVQIHEAEATRFKTEQRNRVRNMNISTEVKKGDKISESAAVQIIGEAMDNMEQLRRQNGRMKRKNGLTMEQWQGVIDGVFAENPSLNPEKMKRNVEQFRVIYDELFQKMNEVRVRFGYEPVSYRKGYFPHFTEEGDTLLTRLGLGMGLDTKIDSLPTSINGLTHTFKPGIQWFGNAQERTGQKTTYDAVKGFDKYIEGVSNVIYHTEDIQKLRALEAQIRYRTTDEGIRKQVDAVRDDNRLTDEEKEGKIREIYEHGRFTLSNFVNELMEYTNLLAGKKSIMDRGIEQRLGRWFYGVMKKIENRVGANMIAGNIGSAMTNFIPLQQAAARLDRGTLLEGMWDSLRNMKQGDDFVYRSDFLTNRRGSEALVQTGLERVSGALGKPMEWIDGFTSESIVRAAYKQNIRRGMSESEAMHQADLFAASVMADRSKGAMPTLFESRNPIFKAVTQFQLEVNNQFSEVFKDMPREAAEEGAAALVVMMLKYFLGAYLFNDVYEKFTGRRPAMDPMGILNDTVGDFTGYQLPNLLEAGEDLITGKGVDFTTKKENGEKAVKNLAENVAGQMPFSSVLYGGRIPVSSAIPSLSNLFKLGNEDIAPEKKRQIALTEAQKLGYVVAPFGYGQAQKTWKGVKALLDGGSYTVNNEGEKQLQYPIFKEDMTPGQVLQAAVMGKSSLPQAQQWAENGYKGLNAKQTALYQDLIDAGTKDKVAYDVIQKMAEAEKTEEKSKNQNMLEVLLGMDLSPKARAMTYERSIDKSKTKTFMEENRDNEEVYTTAPEVANAQAKENETVTIAKIREIQSADISDDAKAALYYGMVASDETRELMDKMTDEGASGAEVAKTLMQIQAADILKGAERSISMRNAIANSNLEEEHKLELYRKKISDDKEDEIAQFRAAGMDLDTFIEVQNEYSRIKDTGKKASQQAQDFSYWLEKQNLTDRQKKTARECFTFYSMVPADAKYFNQAVEAGVDADKAYDVINKMTALKPKDGSTYVSDAQKLRVIVDSGLSEKDMVKMVLCTSIGSTMKTRLPILVDNGVSIEKQLQFWEKIFDFDADGSGKLNQREVRACLDSFPGGNNNPLEALMGITSSSGPAWTTAEKAAMWQSYNKQFSARKNPYDRKVGEKVKADINAAGEKDKEPEEKQTDQASTGLSTGNAEVDRILGLR